MSNEYPTSLSVEKQLAIRRFEYQIEHLSLTQAKDLLLELYIQNLTQAQTYQELLKSKWGIGAS